MPSQSSTKTRRRAVTGWRMCIRQCFRDTSLAWLPSLKGYLHLCDFALSLQRMMSSAARLPGSPRKMLSKPAVTNQVQCCSSGHNGSPCLFEKCNTPASARCRFSRTFFAFCENFSSARSTFRLIFSYLLCFFRVLRLALSLNSSASRLTAAQNQHAVQRILVPPHMIFSGGMRER